MMAGVEWRELPLGAVPNTKERPELALPGTSTISLLPWCAEHSMEKQEAVEVPGKPHTQVFSLHLRTASKDSYLHNFLAHFILFHLSLQLQQRLLVPRAQPQRLAS
jgi:hypothetical protein